MARQNYYLLSSLPHLGELGSQPPVGLDAFLEKVNGAPVRPVVDALLLADDLLQRDAVQAGELDEPRPLVLSDAQARGEAPLPEVLAPAEPDGAPPRVVTDRTWEAYFRHAAAVARRSHSAFLQAWVGHEVALRNAVAAERAAALDLDPSAYQVATDLAPGDVDVSAAVNEWASARDPLAGLRALDAARWRWIADHEAWFTFGDDEVVAYAARLMLLVRWQRLEAAAEAPAAAAGEREVTS